MDTESLWFERYTLEDLLDGQVREKLKRAFTDPEEFKPSKTRQALTEETAREFVGLAQRLRDRGHGFSLVPWTPSLDIQLGKHITGVMRDDGGVVGVLAGSVGWGCKWQKLGQLPTSSYWVELSKKPTFRQFQTVWL